MSWPGELAEMCVTDLLPDQATSRVAFLWPPRPRGVTYVLCRTRMSQKSQQCREKHGSWLPCLLRVYSTINMLLSGTITMKHWRLIAISLYNAEYQFVEISFVLALVQFPRIMLFLFAFTSQSLKTYMHSQSWCFISVVLLSRWNVDSNLSPSALNVTVRQK